MAAATLYYLGTIILLLLLFVLIVVRTCSGKRKERLESPKFRMLDDDDLKGRK